MGSSSAVSAAASATAEPDSADSRQPAAGHDGDVAQAALDVADQGQRQVDDAARQPADVHDLARQHEEGHGQQRKAVGAADQVLRQDLKIQQVQMPHQGHAAGQQGKRDRNADCHRRQQRSDKYQNGHERTPFPFVIPSCSPRMCFN
jgi:hypothetical protein